MLSCSVAIVVITVSVLLSYVEFFFLKKSSIAAISIIVPFQGKGLVKSRIGPGGLGNSESGLMIKGGKTI
jgi:hypothetical protein